MKTYAFARRAYGRTIRSGALVGVLCAVAGCGSAHLSVKDPVFVEAEGDPTLSRETAPDAETEVMLAATFRGFVGSASPKVLSTLHVTTRVGRSVPVVSDIWLPGAKTATSVAATITTSRNLSGLVCVAAAWADVAPSAPVESCSPGGPRRLTCAAILATPRSS